MCLPVPAICILVVYTELSIDFCTVLVERIKAFLSLARNQIPTGKAMLAPWCAPALPLGWLLHALTSRQCQPGASEFPSSTCLARVLPVVLDTVLVLIFILPSPYSSYTSGHSWTSRQSSLPVSQSNSPTAAISPQIRPSDSTPVRSRRSLSCSYCGSRCNLYRACLPAWTF
jgi:hypothetical protein